MTNNIEIKTERLLLRSIKLGDSEAIFNYRSDSTTNQYQGWIPESLNDVHNFINKVSPKIDIVDTWFQFIIIKKENNELIGDFIRNVD